MTEEADHDRRSPEGGAITMQRYAFWPFRGYPFARIFKLTPGAAARSGTDQAPQAVRQVDRFTASSGWWAHPEDMLIAQCVRGLCLCSNKACEDRRENRTGSGVRDRC